MSLSRQDMEGMEYPPSDLQSQGQNSYRIPSNHHSQTFSKIIRSESQKFALKKDPTDLLQENLSKQMILSEEQRIHIEILKNALEEKLADQGVLSLFGRGQQRAVDGYVELVTLKKFLENKENENEGLRSELAQLRQEMNYNYQSQEHFVQQKEEQQQFIQQMRDTELDRDHWRQKYAELDQYVQTVEQGYQQIQDEMAQKEHVYQQAIDGQQNEQNFSQENNLHTQNLLCQLFQEFDVNFEELTFSQKVDQISKRYNQTKQENAHLSQKYLSLQQSYHALQDMMSEKAFKDKEYDLLQRKFEHNQQNYEQTIQMLTEKTSSFARKEYEKLQTQDRKEQDYKKIIQNQQTEQISLLQQIDVLQQQLSDYMGWTVKFELLLKNAKIPVQTQNFSFQALYEKVQVLLKNPQKTSENHDLFYQEKIQKLKKKVSILMSEIVCLEENLQQHKQNGEKYLKENQSLQWELKVKQMDLDSQSMFIIYSLRNLALPLKDRK